MAIYYKGCSIEYDTLARDYRVTTSEDQEGVAAKDLFSAYVVAENLIMEKYVEYKLNRNKEWNAKSDERISRETVYEHA